jgi:N-methylhydantoinase A
MNVDIRRYGLVAFGGAGPVHAYAVARRLGLPSVLCPRNAGVLSALGMLIAPLAYEASVTRPVDIASLSDATVDSIIEPLRAETAALLTRSGAAEVGFEHWADMSYIGQGFEVATRVPAAAEGLDRVAALKQAFDDAYLETYGRRLGDLPARVVTWRVQGCELAAAPLLRPSGNGTGGSQEARVGARDVFFPHIGSACACAVYRWDALAPGDRLAGPAIVEERNSSVVIPPEALARVDEALSIVIELLQGSGGEELHG